jgi:DmsE family decaheme c-type cytochrome
MRTQIAVLLAVVACGWTASGVSDDHGQPAPGGAGSCTGCHNQPEILSIQQTPHGQNGIAGAALSDAQCETCHGPGGRHPSGDESAPGIMNFGRDVAHTPIVDQNAVCENCHTADPGPNWHGSAHDSEDLSCADCHQAHAPRDRTLMRAEQAEVCYDCHATQRAQSFKAFNHPIRENKMSCSGCHDPHQSVTDALLIRENVNQVCYDCHAETRGPFLWEHAPAVEDCTSCHNPHGSNHPAMLTRRPPQLCQQCHSQAGHPSIAFTDDGLAGNNPSASVLGNSCMNCHPMIHGSNHPSGARLAR